jgi:hypothetical protein
MLTGSLFNAIVAPPISTFGASPERQGCLPMRHGWILAMGLFLSGCLSPNSVPGTSWWNKAFHGPIGPDVVQMDVAILECPIGDRTINQEIWALADEQAVAMEAKAVLDDNGFRVGQVGGITPPELQALLTSERNCVQPHRIQLHANNTHDIALGPAATSCRFQIHLNREEKPVALDKGQYTLAVVPTLTEDGRTKLRFTPQIQTGPPRLLPRRKGSGWEWQEQRPAENYTALSWDVTLPPNDYVLIGGRFDCPNTLGNASFIRPDEAKPVQRLLVIRTARPALNPLDETTANSAPLLSRSPPLALQAVRGYNQ